LNTLILCSFEVGALPYNMARILNRNNFPTYYLFLGSNEAGHDSTQFHYGNSEEKWNLTDRYNSLVKDKYHPRNYLQIRSKILKILKEVKNEYHIARCFSSGYHSYLLRKAGMKYNYWSYGSDLDQMCFFSGYKLERLTLGKVLLWLGKITVLKNAYRKSIQLSDSILISPYQHDSLVKITSGRKYFFLPHLIKTETFGALKRKKVIARHSVCNELGTERYFFSTSRHFWSGERRHMADNKGNDVILKAFLKYIQRSGDKQTKLVLIKKGPDIEMSRQLVKKLGIDEQVISE